ncbi:MAG: TonB family protein [Pseudomonadales bacterium]|nr:TonB family protein [Pseudomonadales bacterium]
MLYQIFWVMVRIVGMMLSVAVAAVMTFGLFYFMQTLIESGEQFDQRIDAIRIVDATMPEIEMRVIEEIDKPEPIEQVADQQPELDHKNINLDSGPSLNVERAEINLRTNMDLSMASIAAIDGDYLPLIAIAPTYPESARKRRIEGWCLVKFTVDGQGSVVEDTIEVVDAEPPAIFNHQSKRAASRFRFQPRTKNGIGIEVPDVRYLFNFSASESNQRGRAI